MHLFRTIAIGFLAPLVVGCAPDSYFVWGDLEPRTIRLAPGDMVYSSVLRACVDTVADTVSITIDADFEVDSGTGPKSLPRAGLYVETDDDLAVPAVWRPPAGNWTEAPVNGHMTLALTTLHDEPERICDDGITVELHRLDHARDSTIIVSWAVYVVFSSQDQHLEGEEVDLEVDD